MVDSFLLLDLPFSFRALILLTSEFFIPNLFFFVEEEERDDFLEAVFLDSTFFVADFFSADFFDADFSNEVFCAVAFFLIVVAMIALWETHANEMTQSDGWIKTKNSKRLNRKKIK
jgi:hypothetical protein